MPRYYSKLESVIRHRHNLEIEAQQILAVQKQRLEEQENSLKTLVNNINDLSRELELKTYDGIGSDEMSHYYQYIRQQHFKILEQQQHLERLNHECEVSRQKLVEASRQRRLVEIIYEKRKTAFYKELNRKEQSLLDEMSNRRTTTTQ